MKNLNTQIEKSRSAQNYWKNPAHHSYTNSKAPSTPVLLKSETTSFFNFYLLEDPKNKFGVTNDLLELFKHTLWGGGCV
jgi:hypothetical protein